MKWLLLTLGFVLATPAAMADDLVSVTATGRARGDAQDARTAMLDDAFRTAVRQVTATLITGATTTAQRQAINRDIYRRSRRFIKSFKVDASRSNEGQSELVVIARVDRAAIRQTLDGLGIGKQAAAGSAPTAAAGVRPSVITIASWSDSSGTRAPGKVEPVLAQTVSELGFDVGSHGQVPVSSDSSSKVPLSDGQAGQLALASKAGGAFVVGVRSRPDGAIRATTLVGAVATATVRVVDAQGQVVADGAASAAGFGADSRAAENKAGAEAMRRAVGSLRRRLNRHWPPAKTSARGTTITMTGVRSHGVVVAFTRHLAASRSPIQIIRRRMRPGMVQLIVETKLSPKRLAAILRSAPVPSASVRARASGDQVEVRVRDFSGGGSR